MKNFINDKLKEKFEGVNENLLVRIAEKLAKTATNEEEAIDAVGNITIQNLLDSYGDSRATEASISAVKNYEKKWGIKDGKSTSVGANQSTGEDDQLSKAIQELMNQNKQLTDRLNKMDADKLSTSRKSEMAQLIEKLPSSLRKPYERMDMNGMSDEEFASLKTEIATDVETILKTTKANGALFGKPFKTGATKTDGLSQAQIEAISKREGIAKQGEQPF